MQEIKSNRLNGYLNLDEYFKSNLGRYPIDEEDLYLNGLIDYHNEGLSDKFWILDIRTHEKIALFKVAKPGTEEAYAELISEEIANILSMETAHYDLAIYKGRNGVISYNFIKENEKYYSGFDIISDFYEEKLMDNEELSKEYGIDYYEYGIDEATNKLNNLSDIWCILEEKYKENPNKQEIVYKIMDRLVDKLLFDILTVNIDDHCDNWGMLNDKLSPNFDSARILNLHMGIFGKVPKEKNLESKELLLTVENSNIKNPLDLLKQFLDVSSSDYKKRVIDKVEKIQSNLEYIPGRIEEKTETNMPTYLKDYFISTMSEHLDNVNSIIYGKNYK